MIPNLLTLDQGADRRRDPAHRRPRAPYPRHAGDRARQAHPRSRRSRRTARRHAGQHRRQRSDRARRQPPGRQVKREAAGVLSSAQRHTHFMDSPRLVDSTSASDFRFADLKERPRTVFLCLPPDRLDYLCALAAAAGRAGRHRHGAVPCPPSKPRAVPCSMSLPPSAD
ncbi:type IV secretory system conjugative DNA transfer family protein [Sphingomonas sp. Ag1]|uniref:type IV secretory system conjugative DNA transfer family protein n=1 Tax=Sphingomonas sp. Ag1 TaxID=1642949 RepID=UPI00387DA816